MYCSIKPQPLKMLLLTIFRKKNNMKHIYFFSIAIESSRWIFSSVTSAFLLQCQHFLSKRQNWPKNVQHTWLLSICSLLCLFSSNDSEQALEKWNFRQHPIKFQVTPTSSATKLTFDILWKETMICLSNWYIIIKANVGRYLSLR